MKKILAITIAIVFTAEQAFGNASFALRPISIGQRANPTLEAQDDDIAPADRRVVKIKTIKGTTGYGPNNVRVDRLFFIPEEYTDPDSIRSRFSTGDVLVVKDYSYWMDDLIAKSGGVI